MRHGSSEDQVQAALIHHRRDAEGTAWHCPFMSAVNLCTCVSICSKTAFLSMQASVLDVVHATLETACPFTEDSTTHMHAGQFGSMQAEFPGLPLPFFPRAEFPFVCVEGHS